MAAGNPDQALTSTETRSRAKNTGHAFFFRGNLGLPFIISVMFSVILVTLLLGSGPAPLTLKFVEGFLPAILTTLYLVICRVGKPPRWDLDWIRSFVLGRGFGPARVQPRHPVKASPDGGGCSTVY
jgi:hypothetical protein